MNNFAIVKNESVRAALYNATRLIKNGYYAEAEANARRGIELQIREIYAENDWKLPANYTLAIMLEGTEFRKFAGSELNSDLYNAKQTGNKAVHTGVSTIENANKSVKTLCRLIAKKQGVRLAYTDTVYAPDVNAYKAAIKTGAEQLAKYRSEKEAELTEANAKADAAKKEAEAAEAMRLKAEADAKKASATSKARAIAFDIMMTNI